MTYCFRKNKMILKNIWTNFGSSLLGCFFIFGCFWVLKLLLQYEILYIFNWSRLSNRNLLLWCFRSSCSLRGCQGLCILFILLFLF